MKLNLLGTGGYFPTSRRHTACLMLPEVGIVLDAGSGMCRIGQHLETDRLDIFLSHAHLDHVMGLTYLVNLVPQHVLAQTTVHGDATKLDAVREHLFAEAIFPVAPQFRFAPLGGSCSLPQGGTLRHFSLTHPGGSLGFRLDWPGHSMAYVTDTTATVDAHYLESIRDVDLLVHESYFADDENDLPANTGHSSLLATVQIAAAAKVGRLVLVHLNPLVDDESVFDLDAARRVFRNTEIGTDGMALEF
jgi:ribonuclease BN (tRNA processing enzyme)